MTDDSREVSAVERRLPLDETFDLLANRRRRLALYHLSDRGVVSLDDLAALVAGEDGGRRDAATELAHVHLPRLVNAGVATFDGDRREVRYEADPTLATWLDWARERERLDRGHSG